MKNIRSRIGWELLLLIFVILSIASFPDIEKQQWRNLLVPAVVFAFVLLMCLSIRYRIDHQYLYIVNSLFGTEKIDVNAIYKIEKLGTCFLLRHRVSSAEWKSTTTTAVLSLHQEILIN